MKRREVLSGCGALLAAAGAGCADILGSEQLPSTPTPGAAPTETDTVSDEHDGTATPTSAGTVPGTPATGMAETPTTGGAETPTPLPNPERRREAVDAYRGGFEDRKSYGRSAEVARIGFNRGKYGGAEVRYRDALDRAEQSIAHFRTAAGVAGEVGRPEAREVADSAAAYTAQYLVPFAERGLDAARAAKQGRFDDARDHIAEMRSIRDRAVSSELGIAAPETFERAIGL